MVIITKFPINQKVTHPGNGIGVVIGIQSYTQGSRTIVEVDVMHSRY